MYWDAFAVFLAVWLTVAGVGTALRLYAAYNKVVYGMEGSEGSEGPGLRDTLKIMWVFRNVFAPAYIILATLILAIAMG